LCYGTIKNLVTIKKQYPNAIVGIGIINGKDHVKIINDEPEIYEYSGKELYKLVFGDDKYYENMLNVVDIIFDGKNIDSNDKIFKLDDSPSNKKQII